MPLLGPWPPQQCLFQVAHEWWSHILTIPPDSVAIVSVGCAAFFSSGCSYPEGHHDTHAMEEILHIFHLHLQSACYWEYPSKSCVDGYRSIFSLNGFACHKLPSRNLSQLVGQLSRSHPGRHLQSPVERDDHAPLSRLPKPAMLATGSQMWGTTKTSRSWHIRHIWFKQWGVLLHTVWVFPSWNRRLQLTGTAYY